MLGLLDQMEAENPEDPALVPKARMFELNVAQAIFPYSSMTGLADLWGVGLRLCQVCTSV